VSDVVAVTFDGIGLDNRTNRVMKAGLTSGMPAGRSTGIDIPPEIQRILQDGVQSILEANEKDGPVQLE